jgi:hypothetical protein
VSIDPAQVPVDQGNLPAAQSVCDHFYITRIRGGQPLCVRICGLCGDPDWEDLAEQVADLLAVPPADRHEVERRLNGVRSRALVEYANQHHLVDGRGCSCGIYPLERDENCPERARLFAASRALTASAQGGAT